MNRADTAVPRDPGELRLWHAVRGPQDAPPVLLLHGITGSRRYWLPRARPLADRFRLLVPDLPGFGRSPKPFADYTIDFFVSAVEGLMDRTLGIDAPVRIIGHSLGALIALELAARSPHRVDRVALLSLPRYRSAEESHRIMTVASTSYRRLMALSSVSADWAQVRRNGWRFAARSMSRLPWSLLADAQKFSFRSLSSTVEHCLWNYRVDPTFARLREDLPVIMIQGERDRVAPPEALRELPNRSPNPRLHVISGAGHNHFHTHHDQCMSLITGFLD